MMILFLGRNTENIFAEAREAFPQEQDVLVISRDEDRLEAPDGLTVVEVSNFRPQADTTYLVIANGGSTLQLVPTLKRLVDAQASFQAWDLQRDGCAQVW